MKRYLIAPSLGPHWIVFPQIGVIIGANAKRIGCVAATGYEEIRRNGKRTQLSHRVIWEAVYGPIPKGMQINHKNGMKRDNRIENLELLSAADNMKHAARTGLMPKGIDSSSAKLTVAQVKKIRQLFASGKGQTEIGRIFGVGGSTVTHIVRRDTWKHV